MGGDEFVIVANDLGANLSQATEHAQVLARKIRSSFEESYKLRRLQLAATNSIGIALIEPGKSVAEEILTTADDAMYVAKRRGGNTVFIANKGSSCEAPATAQRTAGNVSLSPVEPACWRETNLRAQPIHYTQQCTPRYFPKLSSM